MIENPHDYRGQQGAAKNPFHWKVSNCWIINGWMHKAEGNFINQFFFQRIGNQNIFMGSYPLHDMDVQRLQGAGITAVLNIMDQYDFNTRGVNQDKMQQFYRNKGINQIVNYPITDENVDVYAAALFIGAQHLYDLIDVKGLKVYLHDVTGVSRAPTLFLCYQALFNKTKLSLPEASKKLKQMYELSNPNLKVIQKVLDDNKAFMEKQKSKSLDDDKQRQKDEEDEFLRSNLSKE